METLQEFCDCRDTAMRVDRTVGVIRGVKILGLDSKNGRSYRPAALAQAAALYEEAKVNVNHPKGSPGSPRDYQERIGVIRNVSQRPEGLFADFHFNPKHALAEQLAWDAEHAPENVGFSHNVEARTSRQGDQVMVEEIVRVASVDLVADPATTRGLFESHAATGAESQSELTLDALKQEYPHLVEAIRQEQADTLDRLSAEVERLTQQEAARAKQDLARRLLREHRLPEPSDDPQSRSTASRRFLDALLAAPDEAAMRTMVEQRAAVVQGLGSEAGRPLARDQYALAGRPMDARAFAEAIT